MAANHRKEYWKRHWPLCLISITAALIMLARIIWPSLTFDNISLTLFGIAALAIFLPYLIRDMPPLKRLKYGEFEAEFEEKLRSFQSKVIETEHEEKTPQRHVSLNWKDYFNGYNSIVISPTSNVEKILAVSILVEEMIRDAAQSLDIAQADRKRSARELFLELEKRGLISQSEKEAFLEFYNIRNQVVHGDMKPTDSQTARVLELAWRLVQTCA